MTTSQRIRRTACAPIELGIAFLTGLALLPVLVLPWRFAVRLGRAYGLAMGCVFPGLRRVAAINLRRAYGASVTRASARRTAWGVCASMGESLAEGMRLARSLGAGRALPEVRYEVEDPVLERQILADPRPKIFVTGHLGSWELATLVAGLRHGGPAAVIARRVDNPFVDRLLRRLRFPSGFVVIEKRGAAAEALRRLRQGESVGVLADENAGPGGVFVEFFGRPASTARLPALLALMTGAPIVLGVAVRRPAGTRREVPYCFRLALFEPGGSSEDAAARVRAITQAMVGKYEQWVRDDPWQWRWIHWRWKTRPEGAEETYTRRDLAACFDHSRGDARTAAEPSGS